MPVAFDQGRISHEVDYRFMLLRNWSLYDAMYYSDYVGSQLRIWTSIGQQNLERLLAKVRAFCTTLGRDLAGCAQCRSLLNVGGYPAARMQAAILLHVGQDENAASQPFSRTGHPGRT